MRPVEEFVQAYPEYGLGDAVGNGYAGDAGEHVGFSPCHVRLSVTRYGAFGHEPYGESGAKRRVPEVDAVLV